MTYHQPQNQEINLELPQFLVRHGELVIPQKVLDNRQYPSLKQTMVKITGRDGSNIFLPLSKFVNQTV